MHASDGRRNDTASFVARPAPCATRSVTARVLDRIVLVCRVISYPLVALILRIVVARAVFLSGQANIVGPRIPLSIRGFDFSFILPAHVRDVVLVSFATQFTTPPISPALIAHAFAYAEFLLPICLLAGFGTRVAALSLLTMTAVVQVYLDPGALWTTHVYWFSILLVLITCGGGAISLDWLIRHLYRK